MKNKKFTVLLMIVVLIMIALTGCGSAADGKRIVRIGHNQSTNHPSHLGLVAFQVFTRYVLSNPSSWSEELVGYLFAWMSLFGACLVTGERGHMNIPLLVERVKPAMQKILSIFAEVIACVFAIVILVYGGVQISSLAMGQMTSSLGVPIGVFYVVMPVCGVLIALYTIINIVEIATGKMSVIVADEGAQAIEKVEKEKKEERK